ncbi:toll/interleukin-1 receptor domain-containing protein [Glutamicibacter sp. AGC13]
MDNDLAYDSPDFHPRVFVSYSSADQHNDWVLRLSKRLVHNGIDVVLDQWDVRLGADLPHFMEQGLMGADRVIVICSDAYIAKANAGERGVGYEKKIITGDLMRLAVSDHVVPIIRDATSEKVLPTFLSGARYVDFRDDLEWDAKYEELLYDLYGQRVKAKPLLGPNPFAAGGVTLTAQQIRFDPTKYTSTTPTGNVTYPYENNNGHFVIGSGVEAFTIQVSTAGPGSIHVYNDPADIATIALAANTSLDEVGAPDEYDASSRSRTARVGDSVVMINTAGRVAAFEVLDVSTRATAADGIPQLSLRYAIAENNY